MTLEAHQAPSPEGREWKNGEQARDILYSAQDTKTKINVRNMKAIQAIVSRSYNGMSGRSWKLCVLQVAFCAVCLVDSPLRLRKGGLIEPAAGLLF